MMLTRRSVTVGSATLAAATLTLGPDALAAPRRRHPHGARAAEEGRAVLDWERISMRAIFTDTVPATPVPVGAVLMGFTSLAVHRAAERAAHLGSTSGSAAVAQAAHDVLVHYLPAGTARLDGDLAATFAAIGAGHARTKGARVGADAARDVLESRAGDGWGDPTVHYTRTPGPGVWTPNAGATDMLVPWLGSLRPVVVTSSELSGPYSLGSAAWAADYEEARRVGGTAPTERTPAQTDTAVFFNSNSATMVSDALLRYLDTHPMGIEDTARLFAAAHVAMTDSIISCWRLKRDVGFWRPFQAIAGPYDDGNPATVPQPGWAPALPMPNYSDYVSGHGSLTGPAVQVVRRVLGETTPLALRSVTLPGTSRTYATLADLEADALMARVWGGFHFRKAVADAYEMAHTTADRVLVALSD